MSPENSQIVQLAKAGLTAEEIAQSLGYNVDAVAYVLANDPGVNKAISRTPAAKNIGDQISEMREDALATLREVMTSQEEKGSVRAEAAKYVLDHELGLKKPKAEGNTTINVFDFNSALARVRERRQQIEDRLASVVEVSPV